MPENSHDEKPKARGGQAGNRNAMRHGLRASTLPPGCESVQNAVTIYRRKLEDAVLAQFAAIDVSQASQINGAVQHETRRLLINRWLRTLDESSTPLSERLGLIRDLGNATDARNKCVSSLNLSSNASRWNFLDDEADSAPPEDDEPGESTQSEPDASAGGGWSFLSDSDVTNPKASTEPSESEQAREGG